VSLNGAFVGFRGDRRQAVGKQVIASIARLDPNDLPSLPERFDILGQQQFDVLRNSRAARSGMCTCHRLVFRESCSISVERKCDSSYL
jgi:hypothetical protein